MLVQNSDCILSLVLKNSTGAAMDISASIVDINFKGTTDPVFNKQAVITDGASGKCTLAFSKEELTASGFYEYQINIHNGVKVAKSNIQAVFVQPAIAEVVING